MQLANGKYLSNKFDFKYACRKYIFGTILLVLISSYAHSQDFSNKGKDFWLAYPAHADGNTSRMALYISSDVNTSGNVFLNGTSIPFTVNAHQATIVQIYPTVYPVLNAQSEGIGVGKGIHITSQLAIVVYAHILNAARSGSSLILPTNTLGREYIAASYKSSTNGGGTGALAGSQFTIVAIQDSTSVEITPSVADIDGIRAAHVPYIITLNRGDVYQLRSVYSDDVTGSIIRSVSVNASCKPIAVFCGSTWTSMNCSNASGGDNLFQQLMPKSTWGRNFITAPFAGREYDIFRIIVSDPAAVVTLNGGNLSTSSLVNNTYYEFNSSSPNEITSDKPAMVVQYMISQTCDTRNNGSIFNDAPFPGDPEMVIINPLEQTVNDITVVSARNDLTPPVTNITKHYLTIIMKTVAFSSLRIDGNPSLFLAVPIGTTQYSYLQENVTASTLINPTHRITADSGFIALAYGLGNVESYGYNAGTNAKDLYQFITPGNIFNISAQHVMCSHSPFYLSITYPFQPTSLFWDFHGFQNPNVNIPNPIYDSSYLVNGTPVWRYKLPSPYVYSSAGSYPVSITAGTSGVDGCGSLQVRDDSLTVANPPTTDFGWKQISCSSDSVSFTDSTIYFPGIFSYKWHWDFGDGTTDSVKNPVHKYMSAGNYIVKFCFISNVGCLSDTMSKQIFIVSPPLANFRFSSPNCETKNVIFSDSSTAALQGTLTKWNWDLGDGTTLILLNNSSFTHVYNSAGNYNVTLFVESSSGCRSPLMSKQIIVSPQPLPGFISPSVCIADLYAQFNDTSKITSGNIMQWSWDFGDPPSGILNTSILQSPRHKYNSTGIYNVSLSATSDKGCITSTSKAITVNGSAPKADFIILNDTGLCSNTNIQLQNISTVDFGNITRLEIFWDFLNDPSFIIDSVFLPNKIYNHLYQNFQTPSSKIFQIKLRSFSGTVCMDEKIKAITVNASPLIQFIPLSDTCFNIDPFAITQAVEVSGLAGTGLYAGTGIQMGTNIFSPVLAGVGTHIIRYTYITNKGCSDFKEQSLKIYPIVNVNAGSDKLVLENSTITLAPVISGNALQYLWLPDQYLNNNTLRNPKVTAVNDIIYTLYVTGDGGCIYNDQISVKVLKTPRVPNTFTPNNDGINDTWIIEFLDNYPESKVEVYDRYGQMVYKSIGYNKPWDGTFNGKLLPFGTYYYIINPGSSRKPLTGYVTLLK